MTRTVTIHLGMHKTGCASLQRALEEYDDGQTRYLRLNNRNHSRDLTAMFSTRAPQRIASALHQTLAERRAELAAQLGADTRNILISGQELSHFPDAASVGHLRDFLQPHFTRLQGLAYIREPRSFLRSAFQQQLKNGLASFAPARLYPNFRRRFEHWIATLGRDFIELVEYDKTGFPDGDVVADFAARVGLATTFAGKNRFFINSTLSAEAVAVLYAYRHRHGLQDGGRRTEVPNAAAITQLREFGRQEFDFSDDLIAGILQENRGDIDWIEAMLGHRLKSPAPLAGSVVFGSEADLLDFAATCAPALADWLEQDGLGAEPAADRVVSLLDKVFLAKPAGPAKKPQAGAERRAKRAAPARIGTARHCLLHLGMNKAGSSTIQSHFHGYDDGKTQFLTMNESSLSRVVSVAFFSKPAPRFFVTGSPEERQSERQRLRAGLEEILSASTKDMVISAEEFSEFLPLADVAAICDYLKGWFSEIEALVYVREPRGFMCSQFQQGLKYDAVDFDLGRRYPAYKGRFGNWCQGLPKANRTFVSFNPAQFAGGDLLGDFAERTGLDMALAPGTGQDENISLSAEAVAVLHTYRTALAAPDRVGSRAVEGRLVGRLWRFGSKRFDMPDDQYAEIRRLKAADIAWMEARMQGDLRPLPMRPGAVCFGTEADVLAYAEECLPVLTEWLRKTAGLTGPDPATVVEALDAVRTSL